MLDRKLVTVWLLLTGAVFVVATLVLFMLGSSLAQSLIGGSITAGLFAWLAFKSLLK